jgi:transketolase C-terminal domain/subunit
MRSTRAGFGEALAALGDVRPDVVVLDGEASDSMLAASFARAHPERFFECYVAEQQMLATAVGMQVRGWVPFAVPCDANQAAWLTGAMAERSMPGSATPDEQLQLAGIDLASIATAAAELVGH